MFVQLGNAIIARGLSIKSHVVIEDHVSLISSRFIQSERACTYASPGWYSLR